MTHFQKTDTPKYIFEGTVSTESQRASRGVLEHWANRNSTGFDVTAPIVSAAALKLFNQNSSAGKALKFPPQLLGDVFADPNLDSGKARLAAAAERRAKAAANAEAKIMLGEWSVASRQDKELKAVFGAMKKGEASVNVSAEGETVDVPQITQFFKPAVVPDGTITHFYKTTDDKFSFEVVGETIERIGGKPNCPVPFTAPLRVLPNVKYADCDASRPANGACRNEAPTSMFGGA